MPDNFADRLLKEIENHDIITLYHHCFPDSDAYGSQLGLKHWLKKQYPDKTILAVGALGDPLMDAADDSQIEKSLAILLDCSTSARVEDDRWKQADVSVRIDHHVPCEQFADIEYIIPEATATCELVALLLEGWNTNLPQNAAQALYEGLIADNQRFSVATTRPQSFQAASYLLKNGADVVQAAASVFASSYGSFAYETRVRSKAWKQNRSLVAVMDCADYLSMGLDFSQAKDKVYALGNVSDVDVWALFTQMNDGVHYSGSLRSRTIPIRFIAEQYGGGGHQCASGCRDLKPEDVADIIRQLAALGQDAAQTK